MVLNLLIRNVIAHAPDCGGFAADANRILAGLSVALDQLRHQHQQAGLGIQCLKGRLIQLKYNGLT
jgi:hypothetical protein